MNKVILIALIAVCVASSAQAFVKRDAPVAPAASAGEENYLEKFKDTMDQFGEKLRKTFNPEDIEKQMKGLLDTLSKGIDDIKKRTENKPEEAKP